MSAISVARDRDGGDLAFDVGRVLALPTVGVGLGMRGIDGHGDVGKRMVGRSEQSQQLVRPGRQCADGARDSVGFDLVRPDRSQRLLQFPRPSLLSALPVADPRRRVGRRVVAARWADGVVGVAAGRTRDRPSVDGARVGRRGGRSDRSAARVHPNGGVLLRCLYRVAVSRAVRGNVPRRPARALVARGGARRPCRGDTGDRRPARDPVRAAVPGAPQGEPSGQRHRGSRCRYGDICPRSCGGF